MIFFWLLVHRSDGLKKMQGFRHSTTFPDIPYSNVPAAIGVDMTYDYICRPGNTTGFENQWLEAVWYEMAEIIPAPHFADRTDILSNPAIGRANHFRCSNQSGALGTRADAGDKRTVYRFPGMVLTRPQNITRPRIISRWY